MRFIIFITLISTLAVAGVSARDWPQWCGTPGKNLVSTERGLPETFVPGEKDPQKGNAIDLATTKNVRWVVKLGTTTYSTPTVARGRVFIGTAESNQGKLLCLDERTGRLLWQWSAPAREVPKEIDGRKLWFSHFPAQLGVCSTAAVDGGRVYFVNHRCEVMCLDAAGEGAGTRSGTASRSESGAAADGSGSASAPARKARMIWTYDMWDQLGVRPADAVNGSPLIDGEFLYVCTSNGVDRDADAKKHDEFRKPPAPDAPSLIVLDKRTGKLLATDDAGIGPRLLHGQWSSPSLGRVGNRKLVFFGGGDGVCYAFEALTKVPAQPVKLKTAWSFDCVPAEYKQFGDLDLITHYSRGDKRRSDTIIGANDGAFVGMSEIIATPVFYKDRVYIAIGRDPEHGRGRGALHCLDATTGKRIWTYQGLDRSLSTVSIADGLLYIADVAGRLHCLEVTTGRCVWVHEPVAKTLGSTLVADGKVYLSTDKGLVVFAAGREDKLLGKVDLGAPLWATPVAVNGTLFVASKNRLWAVERKP